MPSTIFTTNITSSKLQENLTKQFGVGVDLEKYNREQLEEEFGIIQPTVDIKKINNTLEEVNKELDNTSSQQDDEKKNYNQK